MAGTATGTSARVLTGSSPQEFAQSAAQKELLVARRAGALLPAPPPLPLPPLRPSQVRPWARWASPPRAHPGRWTRFGASSQSRQW